MLRKSHKTTGLIEQNGIRGPDDPFLTLYIYMAISLTVHSDRVDVH